MKKNNCKRCDAAHNSSRQFDIINASLPDRFRVVLYKAKKRRDAAYNSSRQFDIVNASLPDRFRVVLYKAKKTLVSALLTLSLAFGGCLGAYAFDNEYFDKEGMALGYSIINGYSKLSIKENKYSNNKIAVYCGLDITNIGVISNVCWYYLTNGVDFDRILSDTDYALEKIEGLEKSLKSGNIKNERAQQYKNEILKGSKKIYKAYDTVGLYIIEASDKRALELMQQDYVDFVLDGGCVPENMKDLNMDGKSDNEDALLIQNYLAKKLVFEDDDENEYAKFVCDINGDKKTDIRDVTALMRKK